MFLRSIHIHVLGELLLVMRINPQVARLQTSTKKASMTWLYPFILIFLRRYSVTQIQEV
jgi:hypothetical protein